MKTPLRDIAWQSTGVSVIWDASALHKVGPLSRSLSLREFLCWAAEDFSESSARARFMDESRQRCVCVAGVEAALDALSPAEGDQWLESRLQPAIRKFQSILADGGGGSALLLWMVNHARFHENLADDSISWECAGVHRGHKLRFSYGIWNGAQRDVQRIVPSYAVNPDIGIGFYLQRIS
jgi:hypothetical protein